MNARNTQKQKSTRAYATRNATAHTRAPPDPEDASTGARRGGGARRRETPRGAQVTDVQERGRERSNLEEEKDEKKNQISLSKSARRCAELKPLRANLRRGECGSQTGRGLAKGKPPPARHVARGRGRGCGERGRGRPRTSSSERAQFTARDGARDNHLAPRVADRGANGPESPATRQLLRGDALDEARGRGRRGAGRRYGRQVAGASDKRFVRSCGKRIVLWSERSDASREARDRTTVRARWPRVVRPRVARDGPAAAPAVPYTTVNCRPFRAMLHPLGISVPSVAGFQMRRNSISGFLFRTPKRYRLGPKPNTGLLFNNRFSTDCKSLSLGLLVEGLSRRVTTRRQRQEGWGSGVRRRSKSKTLQ